jgi:hypothetical protein
MRYDPFFCITFKGKINFELELVNGRHWEIIRKLFWGKFLSNVVLKGYPMKGIFV